MALDTTSYLLGKKAGGGTITESDPIFSASAASGITNADIEKWNSNFVYLGKISDHNTAAKAINLNGLKAGYYYVYTDTTNLYIGVTNSSNENYVTTSSIYGTDEYLYIWNRILYIYIENDIPSTGLATNTKIGKLIYIRDNLYSETYGQSGADFYKQYFMDFTVGTNSINISFSQSNTHNYMKPELNEKISGKKTFTTLPESSVVPTNDNQLVNKKYVDDRNTYSSSEIVIGKWIDNKPLYRSVFSFEVDNITTNYTTDINNMGTLVTIRGITLQPEIHPLPHAATSYNFQQTIAYIKEENKIQVKTGSGVTLPYDVYAILEYTKTTD